MVREARFCWDDEEGREPPLKYDRLDDFDDDLLDPDLPVERKRPPAKPQKRKRRRKRESEHEQRHLAGADWLGDDPIEPADEAA